MFIIRNYFNKYEKFSGTLMGMTNAFATLAGIFAPMAVGALTENNVNVSVFIHYFCLIACVCRVF